MDISLYGQIHFSDSHSAFMGYRHADEGRVLRIENRIVDSIKVNLGAWRNHRLLHFYLHFYTCNAVMTPNDEYQNSEYAEVDEDAFQRLYNRLVNKEWYSGEEFENYTDYAFYGSNSEADETLEYYRSLDEYTIKAFKDALDFLNEPGDGIFRSLVYYANW